MSGSRKFFLRVQMSDMRAAPAYALVRMDQRALSYDLGVMNEMKRAFREMLDRAGLQDSRCGWQRLDSAPRVNPGHASSRGHSRNSPRATPISRTSARGPLGRRAGWRARAAYGCGSSGGIRLCRIRRGRPEEKRLDFLDFMHSALREIRARPNR